jgi:hypothetical protein
LFRHKEPTQPVALSSAELRSLRISVAGEDEEDDQEDKSEAQSETELRAWGGGQSDYFPFVCCSVRVR